MDRERSCIWCGAAVDRSSGETNRPFCRECHETYEREAHRPHTVHEERQPYWD